MSHEPPAIERFTDRYAVGPAWEIGRPQPAFVDHADKIHGDVLDSGCGTGENALFLAARGHAVTGYDFVESAIQCAQVKAAERGINARFLVMDAMRLHSFPERFDSIVDSGVFHSFPDEDRQRYVQGLATVLKSGGRLFGCCFSNAEPGAHGPRRIAQDEIHAAFSQGWIVESITPARFAVRPDHPDFQFSEGGAHAWFFIVRRD